MQWENLIQDRIVSDMSEGLMVIRSDGRIEQVNDAALTILGKSRQSLVGASLGRAFFDSEDNDDFIQCVLDAVYRRERRLESYVPYRTKTQEKQLRIVSSCLREEEKTIGVILVISDITELTEMRDAIRAMERIQELNRKLELRSRVLEETFGRYLSESVMQEILDSPGGWKLGGQKRTLSILMSDLRGFTALSERMQPNDLITMLNHFFSEMYEEIERYRGTLIEFLGDGMLVIFGAPIQTENHADDAVSAAIAMQRRMQQVNRWNAERGYEPLAMGIGINTDEVILGNIGSEKRTKYGVLGAAVNLTGRIESYTTEGQILISPSTRSALGQQLQIVQTLSVQPKGVDGTLELAEVAGLGGLKLERQNDVPLSPLPQAVSVRYCRLEGKHTSADHLEGTITAVSPREAAIQTEAPLELYENLLLQIGGDLYAKVTEQSPEGLRIRFTAKPPCFSAWLRDIGYGEGESHA